MKEKGKKRKTVAKGSSSQVPDPEYNRELFSSWRCQKFYNSIDPRSKFVRERAFILTPGDFDDIRENISARGWDRYVAYPKVASKALVFEFFSNALPKTTVDRQAAFPRSESYVRGCRIPFDSATINSLFGLAPVSVVDVLYKTNTSRRRIKEDPNRAAEIYEALCKPGTDWVRNLRGEPQKILATSLTPAARGWAAFINATICPSSNQTELSFERAILASCIIKGEPVNLGWVLEQELREFANFKNDVVPKYWRYASLVALLCERAGVVAEADEETLEPGPAITGNWIRSRLPSEHPIQGEELPQEQQVQPEPHEQQEQPYGQEPTFTMDDFSVGPSVEDFQRLESRMDVLAANQERMTAEMRENQRRMEADYRFGMRALYRAMCTMQSGGQLDPDTDIFQPPPQ